MQRFFDFADGVERILLRQFLNPLLWCIFALTLYFEVLLNQVQRQLTRWPTEVLLAHLLAVLELSLLLSVAVILIWERRMAAGVGAKLSQAPESSEVYPPRLWLAMCLTLALIAILHLCYLGYFQYVHIVTLLQRALFVYLTVLLVPGLYLLLNPRLRGAFAAVSSCVAALAAYLIVEFGVLWLSFQGSENAFFARLNDVYYWNHLFPEYARKELWLTIYVPWVAWYLFIYAGLNAALLLAIAVRSRARTRRGEGG